MNYIDMLRPQELMQAFREGTNITALLRERGNTEENSGEAIEIAYDLQAGSYVADLSNERIHEFKQRKGETLARIIESLTTPTSVLEAGIGEGTTFKVFIHALGSTPTSAHGVDISWSRLMHGRRWLDSGTRREVDLSVARIDRLPYRENSFDVVYTSHAIEANGGREKEILQELYRVTSRYLILLEPAFELGSSEARERMQQMGYCRALVATAASEGMRVIRHELFAHSSDSLNPTAITIIEKDRQAPARHPEYACPLFGEALSEYADSLYSPDSLCAYPKLLGIPCLRPEDAIIASAYEEFMPLERASVA